MGNFPHQFGSQLNNPQLSAALQQNFLAAATTAYVETASGLLIPKSIGDAKGDLIGFSAADTPVKIAAAAGDGYALTSDTSQTGGVAWLADQYRTIDVATARMNVNTTTGFYLNRTGTADLFSAAGVVRALMYIDPADAGTGALAMKYKLRAWALTETNPTDSVLTVGLNLITSISGGAITGGSSVVTTTLAPNAANTMYQAETSETTVSTAGWYGVVFTHSVNPAQIITYGYRLEGRLG